jgi:hypothetical protein
MSAGPTRAPARRPVLVALGALLLVVGVAPFLPRGGGDEGALAPSGGDGYVAGRVASVGYGRLTPQLRAEVDRVVTQGRVLGRLLARGRASTVRQVAAYVRCADFDGQRYCLGTGWTDDTEGEVQARTLAAVGSARTGQVRRTGDLDARAALARSARMTVEQRAAAERAELTQAARSVAKVWLLRHEIEGIPLPAGFLATHPEARAAAATPTPGKAAAAAVPTGTATATVSPYPTASTSPTTSPTTTSPTTPTTTPSSPTTYDGYPESASILDNSQVAEQERNYWCGPTAMQMIAWGWKGKYRSQEHWAKRLGTTSSGSSITALVRVTNERTGWDLPQYSGPYIALDVKNYSFDAWQLLVMNHVFVQKAPMILHVQLLKQFFAYLDHDGSGHFQVGRGYDKRGDKPDLIGYFEPWNQQRFHPDEPYISRLQWRQSYRTFRATLAHYQHNVGV